MTFYEVSLVRCITTAHHLTTGEFTLMYKPRQDVLPLQINQFLTRDAMTAPSTTQQQVKLQQAILTRLENLDISSTNILHTLNTEPQQAQYTDQIFNLILLKQNWSIKLHLLK
jgi:hypothetical protein